MFTLMQESGQSAEVRIARLEARVAALEAALARTAGGARLEASAEHFAKTQKLAAVPAMPPPSPKSGIDLGITAAFACLDDQVAAAAEAEFSLLRKPDLAPMVDINPELIEDRFTRRAPPPAQKWASNRPLRTALEDHHPDILRKLGATWRSKEGQDYLHRLIVTERNDRAGFNREVMSELMLLSDILDDRESQDTWATNAYAA